jgi:hypothetical protein
MHLHARETEFCGVVARFVFLGLCENAEKRGIGVGDPSSEGKPTYEYGNARKETVKEIEGTNCPNTDKEEQRSLHPKVSEGLVQALVDPVSAPAIGVCLHCCPSHLEMVDGWGYDSGNSSS